MFLIWSRDMLPTGKSKEGTTNKQMERYCLNCQIEGGDGKDVVR